MMTIEGPDGATMTVDEFARRYGSDGKSDVVPPRSVDGDPPGTDPVSDRTSFTPTAGQAAAIEKVKEVIARRGVQLLVICGYAGTGKTTMLRLIAELFGAPCVVTPTGKAALRVQEATGLQAQTIHRWLYKPVQNHRTGKVDFNPRTADELQIPTSRLVLIDEASMVAPDIWAQIWRTAQQYDLKIVAVGDGFQLPPVVAKGAPEFSLLAPETITKYGGEAVELTEVLRQAQDSPVIRASMALRTGMGVRALGELTRVGRDELIDVMMATRRAGGVIISHTNAQRFRINDGIRATTFPQFRDDPGPQPGEPLMVLRNNYNLDVYNGEQIDFEGWAVPPTESVRVADRYSGQERDVSFGAAMVRGTRAVVALQALSGHLDGIGGFAQSVAAESWARQHDLYNGEEPTPFLEANYGYCYTAHKSQGSEWPYVLTMLENSVKLHEEFGRRWAYTAITRASKAAAIFYGRI